MTHARRATTKPIPLLDPLASARAAHLRYVDDTGPGIRRRRHGKGFRYVGVDGKPVKDPEQLERIRHLVIPPAWTDVWICPLANGHIQATGRDARGRKQYRYHARFRAVRDETKYARILAFAAALPRIRAAVEERLRDRSLSREKVLATVVRLLELTLIRIGHEEYVKQNGSFGLTTLREDHVDVEGPHIHFHFRGKSGIEHTLDVHDRRLARILRGCLDLPGELLFQYVGEDGEHHPVEADDVNAFIRELAGEEFSTKDFRTWGGTVLAAQALRELAKFESETAAKRNLVAAIKRVSKRLGNTPAVCRKCYVHPAVVRSYLDGRLADALEACAEEAQRAAASGTLTPEEAAVLVLLQREATLAAAA